MPAGWHCITVLPWDDHSIVTSNKQIEKVYGGPLEDQTVNIYTNQETIEEINSGRLSITEALDEGKIRYEFGKKKLLIHNLNFQSWKFSGQTKRLRR